MRRNARAQSCAHCGANVPASAGELYREWSDDDDEFRGPWLVRCLDEKAACAVRVAERRAVAEAKRAAYTARVLVAKEAKATLKAAFASAEHPKSSFGQFSLQGEELALGGGDRAYGGGTWAVIEDAGDRTPPSDAEILALRERVALADAPLLAAQKAAKEAGLACAAWHRSVGGAGHHLNEVGIQRCELPLTEAQRAEGLRLCAAYKAADALCYGPQALKGAPFAERKLLREMEERALRATYPRSIWFVQNNGHDGDCWAYNNVHTGGAGAVGQRLPWTPELEALARNAAEAYAALAGTKEAL